MSEEKNNYKSADIVDKVWRDLKIFTCGALMFAGAENIAESLKTNSDYQVIDGKGANVISGHIREGHAGQAAKGFGEGAVATFILLGAGGRRKVVDVAKKVGKGIHQVGSNILKSEEQIAEEARMKKMRDMRANQVS